MPIYDYKCSSCEHEFERILSISRRNEPIENECPNCLEKTVTMKISGDFKSVQPEFKPPKDFNKFLTKLKKNTKNAADFRTW